MPTITYRIMNNKITFLVGIIIGLILMFIYFKTSKTQEEREMEMTMQLIEKVKNQKTEIQYTEVKGRKGRVTIHTEIPKDSAKLLLGKASKTEMQKIANSVYETWTYDFDGDDISDLKLEFIDGVLDNFHEY